MATTSGTRLDRTLGLTSVVLFGLAYLTPIIVLGIFGLIAGASGGATASSYLLAMVALLFTAYSYGRMAVAFPVAGSAYTYVRKCIDSRIGFLAGWAILLDYLFLPMVIWLFGGLYLEAEFPSVPLWVWILAFILTTTALNIIGIKVAARANFLLMAFQILVLVLFVALSAAEVIQRDGGSGLVAAHPFANDATTLSVISAGSAIAAYSFLGFDAVSTLTEETKDPQRTIPRAIMLVALIGGGIFVLVAYTTTLVSPGVPNPDTSGTLALDIAKLIGGAFFGSIFLAGLILAQYASGLAAQASVARLLYAMGRDNVLPRKLFGVLHPQYRTPVLGLLLSGAVGLLAIWFDPASSTAFINFGAFIAFTLVNLSVVAYFMSQRNASVTLNPMAYVVVPIIGALFTIWLLTRLDSRAITLGLVWLGIGVVYLAFLTKGFRTAPPEMEFAETAETTTEPVHGG